MWETLLTVTFSKQLRNYAMGYVGAIVIIWFGGLQMICVSIENTWSARHIKISYVCVQFLCGKRFGYDIVYIKFLQLLFVVVQKKA